MPSAPSIGFEFHPSRWLPRLVIMLGGLAVAGVLDSAAPWYAQVLLIVSTVFYVVACARHAARCVVRRVQWRADGGWNLSLSNDEDVEGHLLGARVLAGALVLRLGWAKRDSAALLMLPDNLDADTRRRLRMRLSSQSDDD
ncbi:hypothetical protein GCM10027285_21730 [Oleiagrimonas citrea]|uniref:Toxin CptA n=1 Tax=Oleiagrimonas citrea TaxID=1665687 RepID=A0A846ZE76_9GAMM|nr:protein YgfX [Oleiagrimonas citrea]NKZ37514.1 hypothetical protein [Oleiagrimonas citrea]